MKQVKPEQLNDNVASFQMAILRPYIFLHENNVCL
jgi:hypothetical protein